MYWQSRVCVMAVMLETSIHSLLDYQVIFCLPYPLPHHFTSVSSVSALYQFSNVHIVFMTVVNSHDRCRCHMQIAFNIILEDYASQEKFPTS